MPEKEFAYLLGFGFRSSGLYSVDYDLRGFNEYRFYDGKLIKDWPEGIFFTVEGEIIEDFLELILHFKLISESVRKILIEHAVQGIQYLPVKVLHRLTNEYLGPYWVINVIPTVAKLRWDTISGLDVFRFGKTSVYISERIKKVLEKAQLTSGAVFIRIPRQTLDREDKPK